MRLINVDASKWSTSDDLYDAILSALEAPDWHGRNANALVESIVWEEINAIEPPSSLRVHGSDRLPADVAEELGWIKEGVDRARVEFKLRKNRDVDVRIELPA